MVICKQFINSGGLNDKGKYKEILQRILWKATTTTGKREEILL